MKTTSETKGQLNSYITGFTEDYEKRISVFGKNNKFATELLSVALFSWEMIVSQRPIQVCDEDQFSFSTYLSHIKTNTKVDSIPTNIEPGKDEEADRIGYSEDVFLQRKLFITRHYRPLKPRTVTFTDSFPMQFIFQLDQNNTPSLFYSAPAELHQSAHILHLDSDQEVEDYKKGRYQGEINQASFTHLKPVTNGVVSLAAKFLPMDLPLSKIKTIPFLGYDYFRDRS